MQHRGTDQVLPDNDIPGERGRAVGPLSYVKQTPDQLGYRLIAGKAPRKLVRVLDERKLELAGGEVTLAIIGSSHFMEIRSRTVTLTEVLASGKPEIDELPTASRLLPAGGAQFDSDGVTYRFEAEKRQYSDLAFIAESERLAVPSGNRMTYTFPAGEGERPAITCLEWRADGSRLALDTYHTFPGQLTVVRSRSTVDFPETGGRE